MAVMPAFSYEPAAWSPHPGLTLPRRTERTLPLQEPRVVLVPAANTTLHHAIPKMLAGLNAYVLLAFWIALQGDREALFMVAISAFYLFAYMGTPYLMARLGAKKAPRSSSLSQFLKEPFDTWTGVITGREAMIQVLTVPVAIAIAVTGMCFIIAAHQ